MQKMINGFTYGEVMIGFLLLVLLMQVFYTNIWHFIFGYKVENPTKNKYNSDL